MHYNASAFPKRHWYVLIQISGSQKCTNPKDRVYRLLGIVEHGEDFAVDYVQCSTRKTHSSCDASHLTILEKWCGQRKQIHSTTPAMIDLMNALKLENDDDVINCIRDVSSGDGDQFQRKTFLLYMTLIGCYTSYYSTCCGHLRMYQATEHLKLQFLRRIALDTSALDRFSPATRCPVRFFIQWNQANNIA